MRLVKSENGIGRRTTSFREQLIEDVVGFVVPHFRQDLLGKLQPCFALRVTGLDRHAHVRSFRQRQRRGEHKLSVLVDGINGSPHALSILARTGDDKSKLGIDVGIDETSTELTGN